MTDLTGRTVLVTGASSGIGLAITQRLASTGARVIAQYNTNAAGAATATADFADGMAHTIRADLAAPDGAAALWSSAAELGAHIDVVVLNAAIMPKVELDAADDVFTDGLEAALQVNTRSQLTLIRRAIAHFNDHGGGVLVGLSSWVTQRGAGNPNLAVYAASKAATAAAIKTVARAYAAQNVLSYLIAPGAVDTGMSATAGADRGGMQAFTQTLAMGELVPPVEIAELVATLSTGKLRHLSGATLDINGATYVR